MLDARAVLRPALRRTPTSTREPASAGRADERPLRHAQPRRRRAAGKRLTDDAATRRPTCRRPARRCRAWSAWATPRGSTASCRSSRGFTEFSQQRRRDRLRHDRQRELRRGHVLGGGQRRSACCGAPVLLSIWDDGYGISVPNEYQITKGDLSALLAGFQREPGDARRASTSTASRAGTIPRSCETYRARRRRSCGASTCRRSSTSPR